MPKRRTDQDPFIVVLGTAQDGGIPRDTSVRRHELASCLGVVDPESNQRWLIEVTPDVRTQLALLDKICQENDPSLLSPTSLTGGTTALSGCAITHAHIGHYLGLAFFGRETYNTRNLPLHVMPGMEQFLNGNQPWKQLIEGKNVLPVVLNPDEECALNERISLKPIPVPHRDEFSETVAFIISGPSRKTLFMPDIDSWELLDAEGPSVEELIGQVDLAFLDGTFFDDSELNPDRMSSVPHPRIAQSLERFASLPKSERNKIHFIHFNWTNPVIHEGSPQHSLIVEADCRVALEGMVSVG